VLIWESRRGSICRAALRKPCRLAADGCHSFLGAGATTSGGTGRRHISRGTAASKAWETIVFSARRWAEATVTTGHRWRHCSACKFGAGCWHRATSSVTTGHRWRHCSACKSGAGRWRRGTSSVTTGRRWRHCPGDARLRWCRSTHTLFLPRPRRFLVQPSRDGRLAQRALAPRMA
jgi:hypothetical protein